MSYLVITQKENAVKEGIPGTSLRSGPDMVDLAKSEGIPVLELPRWVRKNVVIPSEAPSEEQQSA